MKILGHRKDDILADIQNAYEPHLEPESEKFLGIEVSLRFPASARVKVLQVNEDSFREYAMVEVEMQGGTIRDGARYMLVEVADESA